MKSTRERRFARWLGTLVFGGLLAQAAQQPAVVSGRLEPDLVPDSAITWNAVLKQITLDDCQKLGIDAPREAAVFSGAIRMSGGEAPLPGLLLERKGASPRLYVDTNRKGRFNAADGHTFQPLATNAQFSGEIVLRVPLNKGPFTEFPTRVRLRTQDGMPGQPIPPDERVLSYSFLALATGTVEIDGKPIRLWCGYDPQRRTADPIKGSIGLDLDGDGELAPPPSPERVNPRGEDVVFHVGTSFVSLERIDIAEHQILMRTRTAAEYQGIDMTVGTVVPDFDFIDFNGKSRRLSEFTGRFVLLDFWGSWCGPCIAEFPVLKRAVADFGGRGLEVLGVDCNETVVEAKKSVAEHQLDWTQATAESTRELVERRLRIMAYPTKILLDGERRIVSSGQGEGSLSGDELLKTLNKLLPVVAPKGL